MAEQQQPIEVRAEDVETAVAQGLARLGVVRDDVSIEIVDEGSRGLLGIGSRPAIVRLKLEAAEAVAEAPPARRVRQPAGPERRGAPVEETVRPVEKPARSTSDQAGEASASPDDERETAVAVVDELLGKMEIEASIATRLSEPDERTGKQIDVLEISGDDLGLLIGPRGETLTALQLVSRMMVGHQIHRRADFVIDIEGYRARREQALSRMAERMATKVIQRHQAISLEAMPPHERRVIHVTLRDSEQVYTQSVGEGDRRRVRIFPK